MESEERMNFAHEWAKERLRNVGGGTYREYQELFSAFEAGAAWQMGRVKEQDVIDEVLSCLWGVLTPEGWERGEWMVKRMMEESGLRKKLGLLD